MRMLMSFGSNDHIRLRCVATRLFFSQWRCAKRKNCWNGAKMREKPSKFVDPLRSPVERSRSTRVESGGSASRKRLSRTEDHQMRKRRQRDPRVLADYVSSLPTLFAERSSVRR